MFPYRFKIYILKIWGCCHFFDYSCVWSKWLLHSSGGLHCVYTMGEGSGTQWILAQNPGSVSTMLFHFNYLLYTFYNWEVSSIMQTSNIDSEASVRIRSWGCMVLKGMIRDTSAVVCCCPWVPCGVQDACYIAPRLLLICFCCWFCFILIFGNAVSLYSFGWL